MKKSLLVTVATVSLLSLTACGNTNNSKKSKQESEASSLKVANSKLKQKVKKQHSNKKASSSSSVSSPSAVSSSRQQPTNSQQQGHQTQASNAQSNAKTQGEINRERGYDPNGNPLLPGQDHAAGSNPDGSPDAWVQWQIDHQNDTTFPDGTPLPNGGNTDDGNN